MKVFTPRHRANRLQRISLQTVSMLMLLSILAACGSVPATPTASSGEAPAEPVATAAPATSAPAPTETVAAPVEAVTEAPAEVVTEAPAEAVTEIPTEPVAATPDDATTVTPADEATTAANTTTRLENPVTLTMFSRVTTTDAPLPGDDWFWYKAVKDQLNIDVKVTFVTEPDQYLPLLQTRAAANDLPDLSEPDIKLVGQLVDQGLIAEWEPYLQYMPKYLEDREITELAPAGTFGGKHYGLIGHVVFPYKPNISLRKDWLDKLGLEIPKTTDEYLEVMKAFTFNDPDGNGQNDTYGFSAAVGNNVALAQMEPIFGAFDALGDWRIENNQLVPMSISPQRLEALKFINQMEQAGVMDPDWKAQKASDFRTKWREGKVGVFSDEWCAVYCVNNYPLFTQANPTGVLLITEPPTGPTGASGSGARSKANQGQMPVMSTQAAEAGKGEAIARLLEWMNGDGYLLTVYGEEGAGYTKEADGTIVPATNNEMLTFRQLSRWAQNGTDAEWLSRYNQDVEQADGSSYNVYKDVLSRVYELPFTDVTEYAPLPPVPAAQAADYTRTITEGEYQFVTGERPFSEWDAHVEAVKANGLDAWITAATERATELGLIQ